MPESTRAESGGAHGFSVNNYLPADTPKLNLASGATALGSVMNIFSHNQFV
jgi:hypothetical protein